MYIEPWGHALNPVILKLVDHFEDYKSNVEGTVTLSVGLSAKIVQYMYPGAD